MYMEFCLLEPNTPSRPPPPNIPPSCRTFIKFRKILLPRFCVKPKPLCSSLKSMVWSGADANRSHRAFSWGAMLCLTPLTSPDSNTLPSHSPTQVRALKPNRSQCAVRGCTPEVVDCRGTEPFCSRALITRRTKHSLNVAFLFRDVRNVSRFTECKTFLEDLLKIHRLFVNIANH